MTSDHFVFVIFGVTGNLAQLKLIPALYDLAAANLLPEDMSIVGVGRKPLSPEEFRNYTRQVLLTPNKHHMHDITPAIVEKLLSKMTYVAGDISKPEVYESLKQYIDGTNACVNRMYYLATYPDLYATIFNFLKSSGLTVAECGWLRILIEKPIGHDLRSAKELNNLLTQYFTEEQIYRLDHYLGKETLQNILTFRFANSVFEPLIHKDYIDHIQVTAAEDFGIGMRGGYYDSVGALRDVGQNHLLQMLALATMNTPDSFTNAEVTKQRVDLLTHLVPDPEELVFGQYSGYLAEKDVKPESRTETFFAFKTKIDNERFSGVPIYIRGGKKLQQTVTEVSVVFKSPKKRMFANVSTNTDPNILIYRIQPNEGIVLRFLSKMPGQTLTLGNENMQFCYKSMGVGLPDPYLRLILDALHGDQTFFNDAAEVEAEWKFTDPLIAKNTQVHLYDVGSWGPSAADAMLAQDGRAWLVPSPMFCAL